MTKYLTPAQREQKWRDIENGKIPDDYTNYFLSTFGFHDRPLNPSEQLSRERELRRNGSL